MARYTITYKAGREGDVDIPHVVEGAREALAYAECHADEYPMIKFEDGTVHDLHQFRMFVGSVKISNS